MKEVLADRPSKRPDEKSSLGHMPGPRWEFDDTVTAVFDDMLARSIPQIQVMRDLVFEMASRVVQPRTDVVDLGCSRGEAMARLIEYSGSNNRFVGVEISDPMRNACRERFRSLIEANVVEIRDDDLRHTYPPVKASVTLSVLTLMFTPIEHRFRIVGDAFDHTLPGGAMILVEKILAASAKTDRLFVDLYHEYKKRMGYTQEEIDRKRLALEGVLVPVTAAWNEQLLKDAGFHHVECFWRFLNFAAWIAVRPTVERNS